MNTKRHDTVAYSYRRYFQVFFLATLANLAIGQSHAEADLRNRYSFNEGATADASGRVIIDSVGGQNGIVRGFGSTATAGALSIPGGEAPVGASLPAYVDLPNGLASSIPADATFECWFTVKAATRWAHLFDFGDQLLVPGGYQELDGSPTPGVGGAGDAFFFSPMHNFDTDQQRFSFENENPVGGGITNGGNNTIDTAIALPIGVMHHVVITYVHDDDGAGVATNSRETLYLDGTQVGTVYNANPSNFHLANLNDVNNWLGRSNYSLDHFLNGSLEEFRIYTHAMNPNQVAASFQRGPDQIPEPTTLLLLTGGLIATTAWSCPGRRRLAT